MPRYAITAFLSLSLIGAGIDCSLAEDWKATQAQAGEYVRLHPADYEAAFRYVRISIDHQDYEAAIGVLQRLLTFKPNMARARKELGFLYARIGAYQSAIVNLSQALQTQDLDAAQRSEIEAQLPEIQKQLQPSRTSGRLQVGMRSQSNANYFPAGGLFDVLGIQTATFDARRPDVNTFQMGQIIHDYDFQNQRGDLIETRGSVYATQQFALPQYNVAMFSGSTGPRLALAPGLLPNVTIKPYVTGTISLLAGVDYLNAGGTGVSLRAPVGDRVTVEPGFEWRRLYVNTSQFPDRAAQTSSWLASGDVYTWLTTGSARIAEWIKLEGRVAYSQASAPVQAQRTDQFDLQAMARFEFSPPVNTIPRRWTLAPYGRFQNIAFAAPNILIDPLITRHDHAWLAGLALDAPLSADLGFEAHVEYLDYMSNISSFRMQNASITFGPTAKF